MPGFDDLFRPFDDLFEDENEEEQPEEAVNPVPEPEEDVGWDGGEAWDSKEDEAWNAKDGSDAWTADTDDSWDLEETDELTHDLCEEWEDEEWEDEEENTQGEAPAPSFDDILNDL